MTVSKKKKVIELKYSRRFKDIKNITSGEQDIEWLSVKKKSH